MMCEWVEDCMTDLSFVTLTDFDTENPVVMQMLHVQQKIKLVPSHVDNNANSKCWNVQPMLTHRPDLLKDVPAFVDVHADMNPQRFDVLRFFFFTISCRPHSFQKLTARSFGP